MANLPTVDIGMNLPDREAAKVMRQIQRYIASRPVSIPIRADARSLRDVGNGLGNLSGLASEFEKSVAAANARVLAFGSSVATITALGAAFKGLIASTIETEAAFKKILVVGDQFRGLENQLGRGLFDLARQTGQSFTIASEAALEFARQGKNLNETLSLTRDALTLSKLSGLDATKSVENLSAAFRIFSKEGLTANQILQKIVAVDQSFAVSAGDISEAISRAAASAQNAKIPFDTFVGLITALKEETQLSGSIIGNSLNSIFTRIQRPEILNQLEQLGIRTEEIKNGARGLRSAADILKELGQNQGALSDLGRQGLFEDIGGIFQINRLIALLKDLEKNTGTASRATEKSRSATNEADSALKEYNKTLEVSIVNFQTTAKQLASNFGAQAFGGLSDLINSLTSGSFGLKELSSLLEKDAQGVGANIAKAVATSFGDILTGPGLALGIFTAGKFIKDFGKFAIDSFKDLFKLNESSKQQAAIQASILGILDERKDIQSLLVKLGDNEVAKAKVLEGIYARIAADQAKVVTLSEGLASTLVSRGNKVNPSGIPTRGGRAAGGFVPDLIQAEYKDVVKGVGGANSNSSIISLKNFPFGGGKKGTMVVNSSEAIMPMGDSAAVLNRDMLDKMGYASRAARGDLPYLSPQENEAFRRFKAQKIATEKRQKEQEKAKKAADKAQKDAEEARQKAINAEKRAAAKAEKAREDAQKAAERLANAEKRAAEKRSKEEEAERNRLSREKSQAEKKAARAAEKARKEAEAAKKIADKAEKDAEEARQKIFREQQKFAIETAQNPPISPGLRRQRAIEAAKESLQREALQQQRAQIRQNALSSVGDVLSPIKMPAKTSGVFSSGQVISVVKEAQNDLIEKITRGPVRSSTSFGSRQDVIRDVVSQVPSVFESFSKKQEEAFRRALETSKNPPISPGLRAARANPNFPSRSEIISEIPDLFGIQDDVEKVRKPLGEFAINAALTAFAFQSAGTVIGNFAEQFKPGSEKFVSALTDAALGFQLISQISKEYGKGGKTILERLGGGGGFLGGVRAGRAGEAVTGGRAARIGGAVGRGITNIASLIPVVAQFGIALFAANSALKAFGIDIVGSLSKQLGFLSESGEKAKQAFDEFAQTASSQGGINPQVLLERSLKRIEGANARISLGTSGKGLSDEEAVSKRIRNQIVSGLGGLSFGSQTITGFSGQFGGVKTSTFTRQFRDLARDTQEQIISQATELASLDEKDLKSFAESTGNEDLKKAAQSGIEALRIEVVRFAINSAVRAVQGTSSSFDEAKFLNEYQLFLNGLTASVASQLKSGIQQIDSKGNPVAAVNLQNLVIARDEAVRKLLGGFDKIKGELNAISGSSALDAFGPATKARLSGAIELRQANIGFDSRAAQKSAEVYNDFVTKFNDSLRQISDTTRNDLLKSLETLDFFDPEAVKSTFEKIQGAFSKAPLDLNAFTKAQKDAIDASRALKADRENEISALRLSISLKTEEARIIEAFNKNMLNVNKGLQQFELANIRLRGQLERLDIQENLESALSVIGSGSPEAAFDRRSEIESRFLGERQNIQRQILDNELKIETTRQLYTAENTLAIRANTAAIEKFILDRAGIRPPLSSAANPAGTGLFNVSGAQIKGIAEQIASGSISIGAGSQTDFAKIIQDRFGGNIPENVALEYAKVLQNATFQLENQEAAFAEENKTLRARQGANKTLELSLKSYQVALEQSANSLEQQARFGSMSVGQRGFNFRQAARDRMLSNLGPDAGASYLSSGRSALDDLSNEAGQRANDFNRDFTQVVVTGFKDGLVGAIGDAISGAKSLKDSLLDAALSFANTLRDKALNNLADIVLSQFNSFGGGGGNSGGNIVGSVLGALFGGVQKRASGGPITGGSGTKDDVPILGMGGEFMINKKSVNKYGVELFEALNQGRLQKMAKGGLVDPGISGKSIIGAANLRRFAGQSATSGAADKILSLGAMAGAVELEPESARLTNFARQSDSPLLQAIRENKDQALGLVFEDQRLQEERRRQIKAIEKAEREKQKQLLLSLAVAAVGAGVSSIGASSSSVPLGSTNMTGGRPVSQVPSSLGQRNIVRSSSSNVSPGTAVRLDEILRARQIEMYNELLPLPRASGGVVYGDGYGDNVVAKLTGGEGVLNRRAMKYLGPQGLNNLNAGNSVGVSEEKTEELNNRLIEKLDELVEKVQGNVVVSVVMDANGQERTTESGEQTDFTRNLQRQIKELILSTMREESTRTGGILRR